MTRKAFFPTLAVLILLLGSTVARQEGPRESTGLPGTEPLEWKEDIAARMVDGIHRFLLRRIKASDSSRGRYWKRDFQSPSRYVTSVEPNRERFRKIIGVVDSRETFTALQLVSSTETPSLVAETERFKVHAVRWPVLEGVFAEGLYVEPKIEARAQVVALPDADTTPEMLLGLSAGLESEGAFARKLAEAGCRILIPTLIDRRDTWSGNPAIYMTNQPHREFVYRQAFQMGRHIIGYEVQKVLAAVDWFENENARTSRDLPVAVVGHGEGGLLALYSAASDERIDSALVSGYF